MNELEKVVRVIRKVDAAAPHAVLLVLDATVGQNALSQVDIFGKVAGVTGLVMTKLDGTARGGILVAIADSFKLPIHFIGVGEGVEDLAAVRGRGFRPGDRRTGRPRAERIRGRGLAASPPLRDRPFLVRTALTYWEFVPNRLSEACAFRASRPARGGGFRPWRVRGWRLRRLPARRRAPWPSGWPCASPAGA